MLLLYCRYYDLYARDIMRKNVLHVTYQSTYHDIRQLLKTSKQLSFPLVDNDGKPIVVALFFNINSWS